jgi:hypothetical protein
MNREHVPGVTNPTKRNLKRGIYGYGKKIKNFSPHPKIYNANLQLSDSLDLMRGTPFRLYPRPLASEMERRTK